MKPWKERFDYLSSEVVGETNLDLERGSCFQEECDIGNFLTDAFVYYYKNLSINEINDFQIPLIGLIMVGDIRASLLKGRKCTESSHENSAK